MASPFVPIFANDFLCHLIKTGFQNTLYSIYQMFTKDILVTFLDRLGHIQDFFKLVDYMKGQHPSIKFIFEV